MLWWCSHLLDQALLKRCLRHVLSSHLLAVRLSLVLQSGVNLASSGTTASVAFQRGNRLWVAAAGDSRAILCTRNARDQWRALPLTIDHRPRRTSERER